jgi:hypothetical protein
MSERNEQGWRIEESEWCNSASREGRGQSVELEVDETGVSVLIEEGSGYCSQRCNAFIPNEIMIALLRKAGYTVSHTF